MEKNQEYDKEGWDKLNDYVAEASKRAVLIDRLTKDVYLVQEDLKTDRDNQLKRRILVRTLFAAIEGIVYALKQNILDLSEVQNIPLFSYNVNLSSSEYAMLAEEEYYLDNGGVARTSVKFLRLSENLRFTFSILARVYELECEIDVGASGWSDFKQALQIRHRLTHPKSVDDLVVDDLQLDIVSNVIQWFCNQVYQLDGVIGATLVKDLIE